jgi:hypothetical protein
MNGKGVEESVAYFKVISQHLLRTPRKSKKHCSQNSQSLGRESNPGRSEYVGEPNHYTARFCSQVRIILNTIIKWV